MHSSDVRVPTRVGTPSREREQLLALAVSESPDTLFQSKRAVASSHASMRADFGRLCLSLGEGTGSIGSAVASSSRRPLLPLCKEERA